MPKGLPEDRGILLEQSWGKSDDKGERQVEEEVRSGGATEEERSVGERREGDQEQ